MLETNHIHHIHNSVSSNLKLNLDPSLYICLKLYRDIASMDPLVSTESTQVLRAVAEPWAGSNDTCDNRKNLQQDVDTLRTSMDNCFGLVGASKSEHGLLSSKPEIRNPGETVGAKSSSTGISPNCLPDFDPGTPLILSPTETVSAASSPGASNDIWDSPETPSHQPIGKSGTEVLTPLTPPMTYDVSVEQTPIPTAPRSLLTTVIKDATIFGKEAARIARSGDEDEWKEHILGGDYFQPKRLSRNLTKDLQASKSQDPKGTRRTKLRHIASRGSQCYSRPSALQP